MTIIFSRLFFSLALFVLLPGYAAAACIIPGTASECGELVSKLPWPFIIHVKEEKPVRITYLSSQGTQQSKLNLKMFLEINDHENRDTAAEAFSELRQKAHPDMGLSYGWDMVLARDKQIYHLHADCTLAEPHFNSMVKSLARMVPPPGDSPRETLFCRCGGGCRLIE